MTAVVHAHSEAVVPFSVTSVPLKPVFHMGGVTGAHVPVWDVAEHYTSADARHDLLVGNARLGASLAAAMDPGPAGVLGKTRSLIQNIYSRPAEHAPSFPAHPVVLMRGHGFSAVGRGVEEVVYRAVFTCVNARLQSAAVALQAGFNVGLVGEQVAGISVKEGNGMAPGSKAQGVKYLSERECADAWEANATQVARPWRMWVAEVERLSLIHI